MALIFHCSPYEFLQRPAPETFRLYERFTTVLRTLKERQSDG